uniref:GAG-pre-integrase domain-containing protein n=1 Tax=Fagus sylvatica TaxID=28930 RepID=A0A2N9IIV5_FAGSY
MWKFQITGILDAYSLLDRLEDPTPCPSKFLPSQTGIETQEVNPLYSQWKTRDKALFSMISSTLSPSAISLVMGQTSAFGIWKIIVNSIKKNSDSVTDYLHKIKEAKNKLVSVGVHIDDEEILHIVLQGLPSKFHSFTSAMLTKNEAVRFEELHTLMKTEEDLLKNASDNSKEIAHMAMVASKNSQPTYNNLSTAQFSGNRGRGRNQNRGRGGNSGRFHNYNNGRGGFSQGTFNHIYCKPSHIAIDCYQRMNYSYQGRHPPAKLAAMATATPPYPNQTTWISDTGATDHFTPDLNNIPDNQSYTHSQLVSVGNGNQLPISHTGNAQLRTSSHLFRLRKILRIQDLTGKPLYKGSSKDGLHPITGLSLPSWNSRVSKIQSSSQHTILSQAALHSSYIASLPKSDLSSTDLWHMRLGHPQHRVLHHVY